MDLKQQEKKKNTAPWWVQKVADNGMQVFAPGVLASIREARKAIPQGLSGQDMANMQARYAAQGQTQLQNNLGNMANMMGGAASPAFGLAAARMKMGVGANTSAQMAGARVNETRNNQNLEMQRRGQMTDAAKLGLGYGGNILDWWKSMAGNDAQLAAVQLDRDKWSEWVTRNRAIAAANAKSFSAGRGISDVSNVPFYLDSFQSAYSGK